ncbi:MAG: type I phosphodiesterase/nucleotide [Chitinophagaceae bacterium]|nr:MAG: type I phosphodiesterase/nucleotide [Chitinophagaceae bacterium]
MAKKGMFVICLSLIASIGMSAQAPRKPISTEKSPKLVVGIVIDQMRWDYLYRFAPLFKANGGFKRMMNEGFSCDNTQIGYTPSVTACGHTGIYTGSVPAIHGITGNSWYSRLTKRSVYCTEDKSVNGVGSAGASDGQMSPKNMLTTTISDELRLASNFKSKVIGIAIKDRGAILPAGHSANGAYWFDAKSGYFITSSYYSKELPNWVNQFNNRKLPDSLLSLGWQKILKDEVYLQYSTADEKPYEGTPFGKNQTKMPYDLTKTANEGYGKIPSTPHGNTLTVEMAKAAILAEELGKDDITDLLAVSFSSPDYIGHSFGPNSWEMVDDYVRLDDELGKLFDFLDAKVGKGKYTAFLSADHAVAHVPGFMKENKLPGAAVSERNIQSDLNAGIKTGFGIENVIVSMFNYQVHLDNDKIDSTGANKAAIVQYIVKQLQKNDNVLNVFPTSDILSSPMPQMLREKLANGFLYNRSGDIQIILKPGYIDGGTTGTTHGLWNPYDAHIPLLFYGWGIKKGSLNKEVYMHDIASTLAALLHIQMPSGNIGHPIEEVLK